MTQIPIVNMEFNELKEVVWAKIKEPSSQRKIILVIVSIALLLDNMLYMVIVPIIPDYLRYTGAFGTPPPSTGNTTELGPKSHHGQDSATGILFASKAIVQLMVNPFSGALIDKIGYDIPMMIGLTIMFLSTAVFACGRSYGVLFFARSLQGVGSAFADTSGLAMIADRFTEENERSKALGIALAFISFGCLVAPPFGGALYQFAGKEVPFLILAFVSLADGFMLLLVMKPIAEQIKDSHREKPPSIPIWRLFIDPYIAVCAGALMMSNVALAFLEPTISLWMEDNMTTENWKIGMIWLPAFFPHVFGVVLTVKMARQYPQHQWLMAAVGLVMEGLCCFIIPFSTSYKVLMIPICGICFGIALIDTALLPTLGYLVDVRYVSVYGSIYAIADISYSLAYAVGPIIAGGVVEAIGFTALNFGIAFANLLYAPVLMYLRHIYDFKAFENEANILMADPPDKKYQTYAMHDATSANPTPVAGWKDSIWSLPKRLFATTAGDGGSSVGSTGGEDAAEHGREFDAELPRLPVPQLEHTLSKYLQMARVLLTDSQYERTRAMVRAFGGPGGVAHRLQNFLMERQLTEENWSYDWWLTDMYLGNPLPLPINSNPGMVLPPREWKGPHDQARFVARLAACLLKHKEFLDRGELAIERATSREKGQPMCMSQFYRLLTSCRVPGRPQDELHTMPCTPSSDEHVIIACKNQFYVLPVKQGGRGILEDELAIQVQAILQDTPPYVRAVGLLTADRRDVWADTREQLMQHSGNRQNMELIERSLALLCLDEPLPPSFNYGSLWHADEGSSPGNARGHILGARDETNMAHEMLHGGGSALNSGNRWFDKTVQLVISNDGAWGLCYEHSPAEGVAVVRLLEQLLDQTRDCSSSKPLPRAAVSPKPLEWYINERVGRHIQEAGRNIDSLLEDLDFYVYRYTGYGKEFIKSCKVSPDAYIQLALQLAYYRLNQKLTATYESASTRRFRLGRVDCIRSASSEARAWADAMCQAEMADIEAEGRRVTFSLADEKRVTLFDAAVARQTQEMIDNILGLGIDIHLLGLRQAARILNEPESEFFQDPTFAKMNHFALSTSQVATSCDGFMGYGPVVPDGYGASYNPKSDSIIFCLSAFHSNDATSTWQFAHSLKTSLNNMRQLLAARQAA